MVHQVQRQDLDEEVTSVALLDTRHLNEQVRRKRLKFGIPSGKHTKNIKKLWKNTMFSWENPRFLWPFSIAMFVYRRLSIIFWYLLNEIGMASY